MEDRENKKSLNELTDENLETVSGGLDAQPFFYYWTCEECGEYLYFPKLINGEECCAVCGSPRIIRHCISDS